MTKTKPDKVEKNKENPYKEDELMSCRKACY
jgi:hypothetical protein